MLSPFLVAVLIALAGAFAVLVVVSAIVVVGLAVASFDTQPASDADLEGFVVVSEFVVEICLEVLVVVLAILSVAFASAVVVDVCVLLVASFE